MAWRGGGESMRDGRRDVSSTAPPQRATRRWRGASAGKTTRTQTQASHFRAALDGAPAAPGAKPRPRLGAALAALDVPALALSDDADAHRRLYELAVRVQRPRAPRRRRGGVECVARRWRGGCRPVLAQNHLTHTREDTRAGEGDRDIRGTGECHTQRRSKTKGNNAGRHGRPGLPRARARREGERPPRPLGCVVRRRRELPGRAAPGAAHDAAAAARAARGRRRRRGRARRQALAAALRAWWSVSRKTAPRAAPSHDDAVALRSNAPPPPPRSVVSAALDAFT